ncbi:uncharacterized protein si:dkey-245n4.2 isoform X1 [Acanthochromis polyacanthus]|uniref:uncharacterized protein si:dkey-245n4.2 isoform X1 n=1 Tax=Acanthochromis polyacanthus TaxID=80966 RepID=UPI000B8F8481|nr:uncharacterized protein si:dkey-245n4.2 isoform X1 [Acanthochromis polyacanthus]
MDRPLLCVCLLVFVIFKEGSGLHIRNKLLGKCLQVHESAFGGRVSLEECSPHSSLQEWRWLQESQSLRSHHTGECLTAPREEYEGVHLQPCVFSAGVGVAAVEMDREASSQAWACSKKGHLTLMGKGLHLSATHKSILVFLSREHKQQGSRWRTLNNQTLCSGRDSKHNPQQHPHHLEESLEPRIFPSDLSDYHRQAETFVGVMATNVTEPYSMINTTHSSHIDPTMIFFSMDYGMGWKITMLVLSSLALVLGAVILILNVYSNRRKKVVCVLKSYTPRPEMSVPGSPVPSEKAPLTEHAMQLPHSSPTLQRGEILIEWKDGTVTPLYEA